MTQRSKLLIAFACTAVAATREDAAAGAASPTTAVAAYLRPFAGLAEARRRGESADVWREICRWVDPDVRKALRYTRRKEDPLVNCGAGVTLRAATKPGVLMNVPSSMTGIPVGATSTGGTSVVRVALRYTVTRPISGWAMPPESATVHLLTVRRGDGWFVATPGAVNPVDASAGGLTEAQLRAEHARLVAAAR